MNDEINLIEEARAAGKAYIASFGGDLKALMADLNRRSIEEGRELVTMPPKPPHPWQVPPSPEKKVG
jgi:hypothetical protein